MLNELMGCLYKQRNEFPPSIALRRFVVFLFLIVTSSTLFSQEKYKFKKINLEDGLSQNSVLSMCIDKNGFLWMGTEDGLNQYDGKKIITYYQKLNDKTALSNDRINSLSIGFDNEIWIGTNNGLNIFIDSSSHFNKVELFENTVIKRLKKINETTMMIGTEGKGLYIYNSEKKEYISFDKIDNPPQVISSIYYNKDLNTIWVGTNETVISWNLNDDVTQKTSFPGKKITTITYFENFLWLGTSSNGILKINDRGEVLSVKKPKVPSNNIIRLLATKSNLWIGTERGIAIFDKSLSDVEIILADESKYGLANNSIHSFLEDKSGRIYVGTYSGGAHLLLNTPFYHIRHSIKNSNSLTSNVIWGFDDFDEESVQIATEEGVNIFNPVTNKTHVYNPSGTKLDQYSIFTHAENENYNWYGTSDAGLIQINKHTSEKIIYENKGINEKNRIPGNEVRRLFMDSQGHLWVGIHRIGISVINVKSGDIINHLYNPGKPGKLSSNYIFDFYEDEKGVIWVATYDGLLCFKQNIFKKIELLDNESKVSQQYRVMDINPVSDSIFWLGTNIGLLEYNTTSKKFGRIYTVQSGLPNDEIYGSLMDKNGDLWVSTNNGLARINLDQNIIQSFSTDEGLQSSEYNGTAFFQKNNYLYFGGINGFNYFHPDSITVSRHISPLIITSIVVNNETYILPKIEDGKSEYHPLILKHKQNDISFEFVSPDLIGGKDMEYEYQLKNYHENPVHSGNMNFINLTNIPPGEYELEIIARNKWGNESRKIIPLQIELAFWQKVWFILLIVFSVILVIFLIFRIRLKSVKRKNELLEEIIEQRTQEITDKNILLEQRLLQVQTLIKEVHHRVKNNMQMISSLINLQTNEQTNPIVIEALEKSKNRIHSMALIHQKLYDNETLAVVSIKDYLEQLSKSINATINNDKSEVNILIEVDDTLAFDMDTTVPIGLITNELLTNSYKYAFTNGLAGEIVISIKEAPNKKGHIVMEYSDNGPGLPKGIDIQNSGSLGLELIHILVEQLQGSIEYKSMPSNTFSIEFVAETYIASLKKASN